MSSRSELPSNQPEIVLSTMASGGLIEGQEFLPGAKFEVIAFRWNNSIHKPEVSGIHGPLHYNISSFADHIRSDASIINKIDRSIYFLTMKGVRQIFKEIEAQDRDYYLVLHPDAAAGVLNDVLDDKIKVPANVILALENDDNLKHSVHLDKLAARGLIPQDACNASSLECLRALVDLTTALKIPHYTVLDIEHLAHHDASITLPQAINALGGVDLIHISGPEHTGLSPAEVTQIKREAISLNPRPISKIVLEGPVPKLLLPTFAHTEAILDYYYDIRDEADN